jgi:membrane fusion protein (multidrug efflux system)
VVDKTFVNIGEYVTPGQRLLLAHNPASVWVEANVKETVVRKLSVGQAVSIHVDAYPDEAFIGTVANIGSAATSQFALLPTPNPSGNFTKITQRIPIRIDINNPDVRLSPGMMVEVKIAIEE